MSRRGQIKGSAFRDLQQWVTRWCMSAKLLEARYREGDGYVDFRLTVRFPDWRTARRAFGREKE